MVNLQCSKSKSQEIFYYHSFNSDNFPLEQNSVVDVLSCENINKTKDDFICLTQCIGRKINVVGNLFNMRYNF